jgi:branched-chain amino acid transport system substrate-binding protein
MAFAQQSAPPPPVKVAIIDSFSGKRASEGQSSLLNMGFAVSRVNAEGGVRRGGATRPMAYQQYDAKDTRADALDALRTAIADGHRLILQGTDPGTGAAMVQVVEQYNKANPDDPVRLLSYGPMAPAGPGAACGRSNMNFYGDVPSRVGTLMTTLSANSSIKRVALLGEYNRYGTAVLQEIKARLANERPDIEIVADILYGLRPEESFERHIEQVRVRKADAILTASYGRQLGEIAEAAKKGQFEGVVLSTSPMPRQARAALRDKAMGVANWEERRATAQERAIAAGFRARHPQAHAEQFDAGLQAAAATAKALAEGNSGEQSAFVSAVADCK